MHAPRRLQIREKLNVFQYSTMNALTNVILANFIHHTYEHVYLALPRSMKNSKICKKSKICNDPWGSSYTFKDNKTMICWI